MMTKMCWHILGRKRLLRHNDKLQPLFGNTIWVYYLEAPSKGDMDGKAILDRFQEDVDKFMTEKGAEGWN